MAIQEITYNDIKSAILEALSEHDMEVQRYGSADTKLRSETKDLTLKLLEEVKAGFKQEKDNDAKLINEIKNNLKNKNNQNNFTSTYNNDATNDKVDSFFKKYDSFINNLGTKIEKNFDSFFMKASMAVHAASNDATETVLDSMKKFNTNGIGQDWNQFREGLKGSKIQLEDLNKALEGHTQAFGTLNKLTGNAAGTYQKLATKAAEYASDEAKLAYDSSQTTEALNTYLEMQRSTGNLDRLNTAEMQNGINKLIKSGDELAKEYGISRDALIKAMQKQEDDVDIALMGQGKTPEEIAEVKAQIAALEQSGQTELATLVKKMVASGGTDRDSLAKLAYINSATMSAGANDIMAGNIAEGVKKITSQQAMNEAEESFKRQGSSAGIMNIYGGAAVSGANKITLQSQRARTARNQEAKNKTDETTVKAQAYENEKIEVANNSLYALSKTAQTANHYFDTMTSTLKGVNAGLKKFGDLLNSFGKTGFGSRLLGWGGALLQGLGQWAALKTIMNSFSSGRAGGRGGLRYGARRLLSSLNPKKMARAANMRKLGSFGLKNKGVFGKLRVALTTGLAFITTSIGKLASKTVSLFGSALGKMKGAASKAISSLKSFGAKAISSIKSVGSKVLSKSKNLVSSGWKALKSFGGKTATKIVEKAAKYGGKIAKLAKPIGKALAKVGTKAGLKKIPIAGLVIGGAFAAGKALAGDWKGAGMEIASAAMAQGAELASITGVGAPVGVGLMAGSVAMDAAIAARDMKKELEAEKAELEKKEEKETEKSTSVEEAKEIYESEKLEQQKLQDQYSINSEQNPEYTELTSKIANNSVETNELLARILGAIEANKMTNI